MPEMDLKIINPVINNQLDIFIVSATPTQFTYTITSMNGQNLMQGLIRSNGITRYEKDISSLPAGKYFITLNSNEKRMSQSFIKMQ